MQASGSGETERTVGKVDPVVALVHGSRRHQVEDRVWNRGVRDARRHLVSIGVARPASSGGTREPLQYWLATLGLTALFEAAYPVVLVRIEYVGLSVTVDE